MVNNPQKTEISVWSTGYQLNTDHKLKVVSTSSLFLGYNRNLDSCEPIFSATNMKKARKQ